MSLHLKIANICAASLATPCTISFGYRISQVYAGLGLKEVDINFWCVILFKLKDPSICVKL
jgi:hypothetical protein